MHVAAYLGPSQWVKRSFLKGFIQIKVGIPCFRVLVNCKRWRNLCMMLLQLIQTVILWLPKRVGGGEGFPCSSSAWAETLGEVQVWIPVRVFSCLKGFCSTSGLNREFGDSLWHLGKLLLCYFPPARGHGDDGLKARLESPKPSPLFGFRT